uniref:Exonuclease domain-containing protein n=1 Tax=Parastrongyloides trichosuri TaxID=131310 RepID=A0A0N4ZEZ2_PARTI
MRDRVGYAPSTRSHTEMRYLNIIPYENVEMPMNLMYSNGSEQNNENNILGMQEEAELCNNSNIMWQYQKPIIPRNSRLTMDMDSERYNKSGMVSLICDESAPYINCVIQALHQVMPIRNLFEQHICKNDPCLSCELNFQFRLMSPNRGNGIASIKNFVRAFESFEAHRKIELMGGTLRDHICTFIENILEITGKELDYTFSDELIEKVKVNKFRVFGKLESPKQCIIKLDYSVWNEGTKLGQLIDLINPMAKESDVIVLFPQISSAHLKKIQVIFERGSYWNYINCKHGQDCINKNCRYKHPSGKERIVEKALGELNYEEISLPQSIRVINQNYILESAIFVMGDGINDPIKNSTHSISIAKDFHKQTEDNINWIVFSSHATGPITKPDAFACNLEYKVPVAVFYMKSKRENVNMTECKIEIPKDVFWAFPNLANNTDERYIDREKFNNLEDNRAVALDAEFISVDKTDNIKSDEIGRISVVGENLDVIIDDYIHIGPSTVNDYKTSVSGIVEGDLNPETTTKHLTTLKVAYLKILYLVEHNFHFIGHGLCNDFNVLNIWVNEIQISDTVKLCRLHLKPMLPLKKLAYKFLDKLVQVDTHDSVEDAKTALEVYRKYETLTDYEKNEFLNEIYNSQIIEWENDKSKAIS